MKLYGFSRSSASYRVRIALNLKGITYEQLSVRLREGDQRKTEFLDLNAQGLVPVLKTESHDLTQSLAIIEWLDEEYPLPELLPQDSFAKAHVRAMAQLVACDIHPINNLRVLQYLRETFSQGEEGVNEWVQHWINLGFESLEMIVAKEPEGNDFCYGQRPGLADICLIPQIANAVRFGVDMSRFPRLQHINEACLCMDSFQSAAPSNQPDFD